MSRCMSFKIETRYLLLLIETNFQKGILVESVRRAPGLRNDSDKLGDCV